MIPCVSGRRLDKSIADISKQHVAMGSNCQAVDTLVSLFTRGLGYITQLVRSKAVFGIDLVLQY